MKRFLTQLLLFIAIPSTLLVASLMVTFYISTTIDYKLDKKITQVFAGDSHIQNAVNDNLLKDCKNIACASESFYFTYFKLKKLLENNPNIKKVYLGASYHSLSNYYDAFITGEFSSSVSPKYFYVLPMSEKLMHIRINLTNLPTFINGVFSNNYKYLFKDSHYDYGSYSNEFIKTTAVKSFMNKRLRFQYYTDGQLNPFSKINQFYLTKIKLLCKNHNVDLRLLNTPLHPYFKNKIPINYLNKFKDFVRVNKLNVIDYSNQKYNDSSFIPDGDHLSVKGACAFTSQLMRFKK